MAVFSRWDGLMPGLFSGHQEEYNLLQVVSALEIYVYSPWMPPTFRGQT